MVRFIALPPRYPSVLRLQKQRVQGEIVTRLHASSLGAKYYGSRGLCQRLFPFIDHGSRHLGAVVVFAIGVAMVCVVLAAVVALITTWL
ncbi:MAG TPA: hypothetical protein VIO57_00295 [Chloroflexota bacterium]